nr:VWA domain-containing protein [Alphaproteobacteria bacterium]
MLQTRLTAAVFAATSAVLTLTGLAPATSAAQVKLKADLGQSVLHATATDRVYLRLSLTTPTVRSNRERPPINVAIVIDRSGSM